MPLVEGQRLTAEQWENLRANVQHLAEERGEWAGMPIPIEEAPLVIEPRYPYQGLQDLQWDEPTSAFSMDRMDVKGLRCFQLCRENHSILDECVLVNSWYSHSHQATVYLFKLPNGRVFHGRLYNNSPDVRLWTEFKSVCASRVWYLEAEEQALEKLRTHISDEAYRQYVLTGGFLEMSPRSMVAYWFRRMRPTIALANACSPGAIRVLAALCLHPIGYYKGTFAGVMVPTDDLLAHLLLMRADEHYFWRKCNQHPLWSPQSGL